MFHNPKCSKCRKTLELLKQKDIHPHLIEYLKEGIDKSYMENIITLSGQSPDSFLRQKQQEFAPYEKKFSNTPEAIAQILAECPILLQRPVVIKHKQVVIARPPELVCSLWDK